MRTNSRIAQCVLSQRSRLTRSIWHDQSTCVVLSLRSKRCQSSYAVKSDPFPVFRDIPPLRSVRRQILLDGRTLGFVPTMGALHDGHLSLVKHALEENDEVFVSIYVNPTQFGVNEDLDKYPQTWVRDMDKLANLERRLANSVKGKITGVLAPTTKVMYPVLPPSSEVDGEGSFVIITPIGKWLEGASRPVFFRGVATVCMKLFNIVQPENVYFGQKDVQQTVVIKRMVKDFHIPTNVRVIPTSREHDGLAMSSRNSFLGERRRKEVGVLSRALFAAQAQYDAGEMSVAVLQQTALKQFKSELKECDGRFFGQAIITVDYIAVSGVDDMSDMTKEQKINPEEGAILSAAIKVYPVLEPHTEDEQNQISVRLIDNVILQPQKAC